MNEYLKNLNRIEFVITDSCTGKCKHCSQGSHISSAHINDERAVQAIYDICGNYKINSLMTFGGEPLLYPETVCKIHSAARKMNIKHRDIITNGYFSKNADRIHRVAEMLAESGVNNICLSVDAFHQETVPLQYVTEFAQAVLKTGVHVYTHPAWLVSVDDNNPYNVKTREILAKFSELGIRQTEGNVIFPRGNALKYLGKYFKDKPQVVNPYYENPKDMKAISLSANGNVLNGNINHQPILEIIDNYRA